MTDAGPHVLSVSWSDGTCSVIVYPYKPTRAEMFGDVDAEGNPLSAKAHLYRLKAKRNEDDLIHLTFSKEDGNNFLRASELTGRSSTKVVFKKEDHEKWLDMHRPDELEVQHD